MTRRVLDILNGMPEQHRYNPRMVGWIGFASLRFSTIATRGSPARATTRRWRMIRLALDAITSFSTVPLRIASYSECCWDC